MSLEDKVDALTTAIAGLTLAINAQTTLVAPQATTPAKEASKPAPAKGKPAAKKEEPKAEATNEAEIVITFEDLKKAVVAAADKDKPATAAALKALGVAKISELKEPQYKAALEALTAVVEGEPETPQETSFV